MSKAAQLVALPLLSSLLLLLLLPILLLQHLLLPATCLSINTHSFERHRVRIGVDFAPHRIGLAYCDVLGNAFPHSTLRNQRNQLQVCQKILALATDKSAVEIVVGLPLDIDGIADHDVQNFNGRLCLNFSRVLSSVVMQHEQMIKVKLFDERYSTREAMLKRENGVYGSKDSVAAACILERYLEDEGIGALDAIPCEFPPPPDLAEFDFARVTAHVKKTTINGDKPYAYYSHPKKKAMMYEKHSIYKNKSKQR